MSVDAVQGSGSRTGGQSRVWLTADLLRDGAEGRTEVLPHGSSGGTDVLRDSVVVHTAATRLTDAARARALSRLSADELARANRFRFTRDRDRFIAARAWVRTLLGEEVGVDAAAVRFRCEANGKPVLDMAGAGVGDDLAFNLSHSGDLVVVAVGRGCRLGVDVERIDETLATAHLERHCLSGDEMAGLAELSGRERRVAFFRCWTRKEAYLKGIGTGIAESLGQVSILARPNGRLVVHDADRGASWQVHDLPTPAGYAAALAIDAPRAVVTRAHH